MSGHIRRRRDDNWKLKTELDSLKIKSYTAIWPQNLTLRDQCIVILFEQLRQVIIGGYNRIAEVLVVHLLLHSNQPGNLVLALLLNNINAGVCMAASANDQNKYTLPYHSL